MTVYGGVEVYFHSLLNWALGGVLVSFMPWLLYPWWKRLQYLLNRRLWACHSQSEHSEEETDLFTYQKLGSDS
jgi:hypothetical protein